jgi:3-deoxy-D-manno-octulosonic-acid transferase
MINAYDIAYALAIGVSAPVWLLNSKARQKVLQAFRQRLGQVAPRSSTAPAVMIHAVSLGEMNATRGLVQRLRDLRPDLHLIISTTTETGYARAQELYGKPDPGTTILHYPLDFSPAIRRVLDHLRPSIVVLMELEIWPNFLRHCSRRNIPVILVNGRMTEPSFRRYKLVKPIVRRMFQRLASLCVQDQLNADRFLTLGAPPDRVHITGTMKFDTATVADHIPGDADLAAAVGLHPGHEPIWLCGSTGPGEEQIVLDQYRNLLRQFPTLRLIIVPRHPQRFDEVAQLITAAGFPVVRRSQPDSALSTQHSALPVILGDTMGELHKFYSLANIVFVGRTLVDLGHRQHGSDMIEPAALAKPVIVGPFTTNFADAMARFREAHAIREIAQGKELFAAVTTWLSSPDQAAAQGRLSQQVVVAQKGATERHAQIIMAQLG